MAVTGAVVWRANTTVPSGFLLADGQAVSRATFAALFAAIGTDYGVGDGSTTFNVPNLIDRHPIGVGAPVVRGSTGGATAHTHAGNSHTHPVTQPSAHATHAGAGSHFHDSHTTTSLVGTTGTATLNLPATHDTQANHAHDAHSAHVNAATVANTGTTGANDAAFIELVPVVAT